MAPEVKYKKKTGNSEPLNWADDEDDKEEELEENYLPVREKIEKSDFLRDVRFERWYYYMRGTEPIPMPEIKKKKDDEEDDEEYEDEEEYEEEEGYYYEEEEEEEREPIPDKIIRWIKQVGYGVLSIGLKMDKFRNELAEKSTTEANFITKPLIYFARLPYIHQLSVLGLSSFSLYYIYRFFRIKLQKRQQLDNYRQKKILIIANGPSETVLHLSKSLLASSPSSLSILSTSVLLYQSLQFTQNQPARLLSNINNNNNNDNIIHPSSSPLLHLFEISSFSNPSLLQAKIEEIAERMGGMDIVIMNAGIDNYAPYLYTPQSNLSLFRSASEICRQYLRQSKTAQLIVNCSIDQSNFNLSNFLYPEIQLIRDYFHSFELSLSLPETNEKSTKNQRKLKTYPINLSVLFPSDFVPSSPPLRSFSLFDWLSPRRPLLSPPLLASSILFLASTRQREFGFDYSD